MAESSQKFDHHDYPIDIIGKHIEITQPIKEYVHQRIEKVRDMLISHVNFDIIKMKVILDVQKLDHSVDIMLRYSHFNINVHAVTHDLYVSIDKAFERLHVKLRKWKSRIQDHSAKGVSVTEMEINVLEHVNDEERIIDQEIIDANNYEVEKVFKLPKVIKKKKRALKMLTLDEAVMKMELSVDNFLVYRSEEEQVLKVIYRRRNGSYGILSPEA